MKEITPGVETVFAGHLVKMGRIYHHEGRSYMLEFWKLE